MDSCDLLWVTWVLGLLFSSSATEAGVKTGWDKMVRRSGFKLYFVLLLRASFWLLAHCIFRKFRGHVCHSSGPYSRWAKSPSRCRQKTTQFNFFSFPLSEAWKPLLDMLSQLGMGFNVKAWCYDASQPPQCHGFPGPYPEVLRGSWAAHTNAWWGPCSDRYQIRLATCKAWKVT